MDEINKFERILFIIFNIIKVITIILVAIVCLMFIIQGGCGDTIDNTQYVEYNY